MQKTIKVKPATLETTGLGFMTYAHRYGEVAIDWERTSRNRPEFDPVLYQLFCLSLELHLKSFIWLKDRIGRDTIKRRYGHNLQRLWDHSKTRGINRFATTTELRDQVVGLVGPYYRRRQFSYFDLTMMFTGFFDLKSEPRVIPTLRRLTHQLRKSLERPILSAT